MADDRDDGRAGPGAGGRPVATASGGKRAFLRVIGHTLNRVVAPLARAGYGPWSLVRHVGRRTGRVHETPLLLARTRDGFVAVLTYGPGVDWYRNIAAAGRCVVVHGGRQYAIDRIEPCSSTTALAAFGGPRARLMRRLHLQEFRLLRIATAPPAAAAEQR